MGRDASSESSGLTVLFDRMAAIRLAASCKLLIALTDWASRPSALTIGARQHPPCTTIRLCPRAASRGTQKLTDAFDGGRLTSDGGVTLLSLAERRLDAAGSWLQIADGRDPSRVIDPLTDILRAGILAMPAATKTPTASATTQAGNCLRSPAGEAGAICAPADHVALENAPTCGGHRHDAGHGGPVRCRTPSHPPRSCSHRRHRRAPRMFTMQSRGQWTP